MSMKYIRDYYKVPAKRGMRVRFTDEYSGASSEGVITSADGAHLRIRMDGDNYSLIYHPVWGIEYMGETK